ncbi:MAG: branched-chain amino acid ABC transporter permease [Acidimicrobiales bacterium]
MATDPLLVRLGRSTAATAVLAVVLFAGAQLYQATGGGARQLLVKELLINLVLVLGLQVFIGNTGVLSFGHLAFAQLAAYGTAIAAIPVARKARSLPDIPFGLGEVHLGPGAATVVGVLVALAFGALIGIAVARAGGLAATMITLAVLFVVDSSVKNWEQLTKGAGGLSSVPKLDGSAWLWLAVIGALLVAHGFAESRPGRFAIATREDEVAAPALGIGLFSARYGAWLVSMVLVGLAGALRVQVIGSTNPRQYTLDVAVLLLAMLVVGGMRTVSGAVVGTVLITAGTEVFRQLGDPERLDIDRFPTCSSASPCWRSCSPGPVGCSVTPICWVGCADAPTGRHRPPTGTCPAPGRAHRRGGGRALRRVRRPRRRPGAGPSRGGRGHHRPQRGRQDDVLQRAHRPGDGQQRCRAPGLAGAHRRQPRPGGAPVWAGRSRTCGCSATCRCGRTWPWPRS